MGNKQKHTTFYVSRQNYYYSGGHIVEVTTGGGDYSGADMLNPKYPGEGEDYDDPRKAIEAAMAIRDAWKADKPDLEIEVAAGCTGGMGMELEPQDSDEELKAWAEKWYEKLPKCSRCGEVLPAQHYTVQELDDEEFCSEFCAEESARAYLKDQEELAGELEEAG